MKISEKNMVNAGIIFMFTAWIQGQMSDLVIFQNNPNLIPDFVNNPSRVPKEFHRIRVAYWERQFGSIKTEFKKAFSHILTHGEKREIEAIYHLRNMIAHAHVSVGRDYMLYRPFGGKERELKLESDLKIQSVDDPSDPMILKLEFWREDLFKESSDLIEHVDQVILKRMADSIGVPHGRIR